VSTTLVGFDGTERCTTELAEPDRYSALFRTFDDGTCAVRGAGLSYCLAGAGEGTTVSVRHFDRVLAFDPDLRLVTVEPGLTVGALNDFVVERGCYFPVLPGHPSITVGGCAGFNVHGKTQHTIGHFSDHVVALTLFHPDHGELRCVAGADDGLLELTLGAMGLTGCILDITLRLQPLAGTSVRRRAHLVGNLREAVDVMRSVDADALYSWNDLNARGERFGRGVVYEERFVADERRSHVRYRTLRAAPRRTPGLWNPATVALVGHAYPWRDRVRPDRVRTVHDAAFPINGNEGYFAGFGRRGFREYQLVIAYDAWDDATRDVARLVARSEVPVTLGSLKLFAGTPRHLWFLDDGVCLTVDAVAGPGTDRLFAGLDDIAVAHGARVNVAKDSRLSARAARALFPEYDDVRTALERFDPRRRLDTVLRRRLDL
jgi:decaprenylphospho-beta-D-ribofuranose 2-oxidase